MTTETRHVAQQGGGMPADAGRPARQGDTQRRAGDAPTPPDMAQPRGGPLAGLRIVEMVGIGPAPLAAMLLADMGAEVIRIDRPAPADVGIARPTSCDVAARSRPAVAVDLKQPRGVAFVRSLIDGADAMLEGFRPGVMERLGLGPDACLSRNPRLVYGRLTGWGQDGPLAQAAGHDLNYIALSGVLDAIGREGQPPTPPLNLLGDYAGGSFLMAFGMVCALLHAARGGQGQVVDAAMIDGVSLLAAPLMGLRAAGLWQDARGTNLLDGGAPHYDVYACADGRYLSVAPIEGKFRTPMLRALGFDPDAFPDLSVRGNWAEARRLLADRFAERPQAHWCRLLEGIDACVAPVLSLDDAPLHPHHRARGTFVTCDGVLQPAPAPRFSRTPADAPTPPRAPGDGAGVDWTRWGIADDALAALRRDGVVGRRHDEKRIDA